MRRRGLVRGLAVVLALACVCALGVAAAARGLSSRSNLPPLDPVERASVEAKVGAAIKLEETAFHFIDHEGVAENALREAVSKVRSAEYTLEDFSGAGGALPQLEFARSEDGEAMKYLKEGRFHHARTLVALALRHKEFALDDAKTLPPPPTSTSTPTPSTGSLLDCSFDPSVGQLEVKVSWQGEGGATVRVAVGPSSNQLTTTLNGSGVGYVGPFTIQAGTTYPIFIQASNPTTGKTAQATATGFEGSSTATDCQVQGG